MNGANLKLAYESFANTETNQDPSTPHPFTITRDRKFFTPFLAIHSDFSFMTKPILKTTVSEIVRQHGINQLHAPITYHDEHNKITTTNQLEACHDPKAFALLSPVLIKAQS